MFDTGERAKCTKSQNKSITGRAIHREPSEKREEGTEDKAIAIQRGRERLERDGDRWSDRRHDE